MSSTDKVLLSVLAISLTANYYLVGRNAFDCGPDLFTTEDLLRTVWQRHMFIIVAVVSVVGLFHLPYYWSILRWFFRKFKTYRKIMVHDASAIVGSVSPMYTPEKFVPGSDYFSLPKEPAFQVNIYTNDVSPSTYDFLGVGWRCGDMLVTAGHVIDAHNKIRIKRDDKFYDFSSDAFTKGDCDVAYVLLPSSVWTNLAVKAAVLPKRTLGYHQVVTICSRNMASTGMLKVHTSMPYLLYEGSTKPGFSGAPYYSGNTVFGMHVGANSVNLAIDSTFIAVTVFRGETPIYMERILRTAKREGRKIKYKTYSTPDTLYVLSDGKYLAVEYEDVPEDLRGVLEYDVGPGRYDAETAYPASDLRPTSSEKLTFDAENVESTLNLKRASAIAEARTLRQVEVAPPLRRSRSGNPSQSRPRNMDGPALTVAQLSEALGPIVALLRTQKEPQGVSSNRRNSPSTSKTLGRQSLKGLKS